MSGISNKLDSFLSSAQKKLIEQNRILPIKVEDGILVGTVKIISVGSNKNIIREGKVLYEGIFLNAAAIKIANLMARFRVSYDADKLYRADQEYGRYFVDSQLMRIHYQKNLNKNDHVRADIFYARYELSKARATQAKSRVERMANL